MNLIPSNGVPLIDKDAPPLVDHVSTPKVAEIQLRYGQFLGLPLRAPRTNEFEISGAFEAPRFVVIKMEPDERPEMAWTKEIKPGMCVSMTPEQSAVIMRADIADTIPLGRLNKVKDPKGQVIEDVLNMNSGQILSWDSRELMDSEFESLSKRISRNMKAAQDRENELSMGPHA